MRALLAGHVSGLFQKVRENTMTRRKIFSLSAFAALALALAATNADPAGAVTDVSDSDWTVVAMDSAGSWGVGTAVSTNLAISMAFANCRKMSKKAITRIT